MPYTAHFQHANDIIDHLDTIVPKITDPVLVIKYIGFVAIAAVTVYEIAIKNLFIEFANNKHNVFGNFTEAYFERINGRISLDNIRKDYIRRFGERYIKRFNKKLEDISNQNLLANRRDIRSSYSNLITWRNDFAHEGVIKTNATYLEVKQAYEDGKEVVRCLAETMVR